MSFDELLHTEIQDINEYLPIDFCAVQMIVKIVY